MNHQPFRDWLLSEDDLSAEQIHSLQEHLAACEACARIKTSGKELEILFHNSPEVGPAAGFTQRWQAHLAEYQSSQQRRRGWLTIGATALMAVFLLIIVASQVWELIQEPGPYILVWLHRMVSVVSIYFLLKETASMISWSTPFITFIGMFFLVGTVSFLSVLWLAAYKKFSLARRVG